MYCVQLLGRHASIVIQVENAATHNEVRVANDNVEDGVECAVDWQSVPAQAHNAEPGFLHEQKHSTHVRGYLLLLQVSVWMPSIGNYSST